MTGWIRWSFLAGLAGEAPVDTRHSGTAEPIGTTMLQQVNKFFVLQVFITDFLVTESMDSK